MKVPTGRMLALALLVACGRSSGPMGPGQPAPSPAPAPAPPAPALGSACGLPPGGGSGAGCPYELPVFAGKINEAIAQVQNEHPDWFDFNQHFGGLAYRVKNPDGYVHEVARNLEKMGFCAVWDGEEIAIKTTNAWNEQYDILTAELWVRWGGGAYMATCYPAWF